MGDKDGAIKDFEDGMMVDNDLTMKAQIRLHVQQMQQGQLFKNVPQIGDYSAAGIGPNSALTNPNFFGSSFKDMIKIGGTGKEKKKAE